MNPAPAPWLLAQNIGEYGALAGLAATFQSAMYQADAALRQPRTAIPILIGVLVAAYFLLRRRA